MIIANKSFSGVLAVGELGVALMTLSETFISSNLSTDTELPESLVFCDVEKNGVYEWGQRCFGAIPIYAGIYPFEGSVTLECDSITKQRSYP